jgi:phosphoglucosamine mutase
MRVYPQKLVNVRLRERKPLEALPSVQTQIKAAEAAFGESGRVLVRFSGTEPMVRVMTEGPDDDSVGFWTERIATAIREEIGA